MTVRNGLLVLGLLAVAALVQATWLPALSIGGEWPDLITTVVLVTALLLSPAEGLLAGLLGGLLLGWLSGLAVVAFVISRLVTAGLVGRVATVWHRHRALVQMAVVLLGVGVAEVLFVVLYPSVAQPGWAERVLLRAGLSAAVAPMPAWLLMRLSPAQIRTTP